MPWGSFLAAWGGGPWRSLAEVPRGHREALEASWKPLGSFLELLKVFGRLRGGFQGLMGRSWKRLGALLEAVLEASWTPRGCPKEAQEAPKWSPKGVLQRQL